MDLFKSKSLKTEIFIAIGTGCPTNCQSCSQALKKTTTLSLSEVKKQIDTSHRLSDVYFSYFLYGVRKHNLSKLSQISKYMSSIGRDIKLQIDITTSHDEIIHIQNSTSIGEYVISKKIDTATDLKVLIKAIHVFSKQKDYIIQFDILLKKSFSPILEKIFGNLYKNPSGFLTGRLGRVFLHIQPLYTINYQKKNIEGLSFSSCIIAPIFDTGKDHIMIYDHYEINSDLDIMFHNPLCFLGNNKISNLEKTNETIIQHFNHYKSHLDTLNHDLETNCFTCISNGFNYSSR